MHFIRAPYKSTGFGLTRFRWLVGSGGRVGAIVHVGMCADIKVSAWLGLWSTVDVGLAGLVGA